MILPKFIKLSSQYQHAAKLVLVEITSGAFHIFSSSAITRETLFQNFTSRICKIWLFYIFSRRFCNVATSRSISLLCMLTPGISPIFLESCITAAAQYRRKTCRCVSYLVSNLQVEVTSFGMVSQINPVTIITDDVLRSRILVGTTSH